MLMDAVSFGIGGFIGTVVGYLLCALMTISKEPTIEKVLDESNACVARNCSPYKCKAWSVCDSKWSKSLNIEL